jgi:hypothetical protein
MTEAKLYIIRFDGCGISVSLSESFIHPRPTKRAPDGWWAPRFWLDSSEALGSVSLVGSLQPPVTQAVGQLVATDFLVQYNK